MDKLLKKLTEAESDSMLELIEGIEDLRGISTDQLEDFIKHKPLQIASRLLKIYGDEAEPQVKELMPDSSARDQLLAAMAQRRRWYSNKNWNKGIVREY